MANQTTERNQPSNMQTYGVPIYAADWIPEETVRSKVYKDQENPEDGGESSSSSSSSSRSCIVLSGGGGEGRSGIHNAILICRVDLETNSLSEQPVSSANGFISFLCEMCSRSIHLQGFLIFFLDPTLTIVFYSW